MFRKSKKLKTIFDLNKSISEIIIWEKRKKIVNIMFMIHPNRNGLINVINMILTNDKNDDEAF